MTATRHGKSLSVAEAASALGAASILALIFGAVMTIDCRSWAKEWQEAQACYFHGGSIMGLGGIGKTASGMFMAGYNTYNPELRQSGQRSTKRESDEPT
jgi:hypothetical protein